MWPWTFKPAIFGDDLTAEKNAKWNLMRYDRSQAASYLNEDNVLIIVPEDLGYGPLIIQAQYKQGKTLYIVESRIDIDEEVDFTPTSVSFDAAAQGMFVGLSDIRSTKTLDDWPWVFVPAFVDSYSGVINDPKIRYTFENRANWTLKSADGVDYSDKIVIINGYKQLDMEDLYTDINELNKTFTISADVDFRGQTYTAETTFTIVNY